MMDHCDELYDITDEYTDRWLSSAHALLEECLGRKEDSVDGDISSTSRTVGHINVLVTSGALIPSLVKCLLFRLNDFIAHNNDNSVACTAIFECEQYTAHGRLVNCNVSNGSRNAMIIRISVSV
ncbi:uncharacterized protein LOC110812959 isoform X3 [Carica papaya]|uniref:uncharacterized protein LOC110812959 isoform X3 n=1 Tax=Carica papaya TaxID=3649 RepID=UPI000B8CA533|nr:uncharacterized protein LOC110812959 isoform X3 [Carica papaya]